jgi:hypothetical protein
VCAAAAESNYFNFFERICVNEWNLRPLKRDRPTGFTRFKEGITNLEIVPTSINYSSFSKKTKDSIIHFNASFKPETLTKTRAAFYNSFTTFLKLVFYKK